jgi:hypothetical protein
MSQKTMRTYEVRLKGVPDSGGLFRAESAGKARYAYMLGVGDVFPDGLRFSDVVVRSVRGVTPRKDGVRLDVALEEATQAALVRQWNEAHRVGVAVVVRLDGGGELLTTTRSPAHLLGGHSAVVWVHGLASCYALSHVTPIQES